MYPKQCYIKFNFSFFRCHNMGFPCERARHRSKEKSKQSLNRSSLNEIEDNYRIKESLGDKIEGKAHIYETFFTTTTPDLQNIGNVVVSRFSKLLGLNLCHKSATTTNNSHYLVRQSLCLYAASSVILALCYLTTPVASDTPHPM